jgi:hypothetical protein
MGTTDHHQKERVGGRRLPTFLSYVAAACVGALLLPVAVRASGNLITIVGPGSNNQANGVKVQNGALKVGDGQGPVTIDGQVRSAGTTKYLGSFAETTTIDTRIYRAVRVKFEGDADFAVYCVEGGDEILLQTFVSGEGAALDVPCRALKLEATNIFLPPRMSAWGRT